MKRSITLYLFLTIILAACSTTQPISIPTASQTVAPMVTASPTMTLTPASTESPSGLIAPLGSWVEYDEWRRYIAVDASGDIRWVYDAKNEAWVDFHKVIQPNKFDSENYMRISTWDEFRELVRLEKIVLPPFPKDTYFPPLDKIYKDYEDDSDTSGEGDFNFIHPFGTTDRFTNLPFRIVNYTILERGEGRYYDTYIVTEQVFNPKDGSFSLFHFGFDEYSKGSAINALLNCTYVGGLELGRYVLPVYKLDAESYTNCSWFCNQLRFLRKNGYVRIVDSGGELTGIEPLVREWLASGIVPDKMESIIFIGTCRLFRRW